MKTINCLTAVAIIYRGKDPSQLFVEIKDEGYPNPLFRHHIFLLGGHREAFDIDAYATIVRELHEELKIDGLENEILENVLEGISRTLLPFQDYLFTIPREVFSRATPESTKNTWTEVTSVWHAPLDEDSWQKLTQLQTTHKNLSTESTTAIVSLENILRDNSRISWEVAAVLQKFLLQKGYSRAAEIPLMEGVLVEPLGLPKNTYVNYSQEWQIAP